MIMRGLASVAAVAALLFGPQGLPGAHAQPVPETGTPADPAPPVEDIPSDEDIPARPGTPESSTPAPAPVEPGSVTGVILGGLDKITGRTIEIPVKMDESVKFGTLTIRLRQCIEAPPDEKPESSAFLEITDEPPGLQQPIPVFSGWMFASSPALSALEHPVYDVWVNACMTAAPGNP